MCVPAGGGWDPGHPVCFMWGAVGFRQSQLILAQLDATMATSTTQNTDWIAVRNPVTPPPPSQQSLSPQLLFD